MPVELQSRQSAPFQFDASKPSCKCQPIRYLDRSDGVGQPLPETVVVIPVPDDPKYAYAIINDQRVIVEPSSLKVIQVIQ
jgi:hypothetical protein